MAAATQEIKGFATEQGHFYCPKTGEPRYTYTNAKGGISNTTVREARKFGWVPSVTQILRQAAAPGLEKWKIGNAILSALTLARQEGESDEDYISRIVRDSNEQAARARDRGTEIHGAIEKLDRHGPYAAHVDAAMGAVSEWAGIMDWDAERSFASPLGFGGKIDLSAPGFVCDFKTTDKPLFDDKERGIKGVQIWPEHRRQLSAYRHGLGMPEARCSICYVSSVKPEARLIELDKEELEQGWSEFKALLAFYYAMNRLPLPEISK